MKNLKIDSSSENGNRIKGQTGRNRFLRYGLENPLDKMIEYPHQVTFDEDIILKFEELLPKKLGGKLPDEGWNEDSIPKSERVFKNAVMVSYDLGGEYCRRYSTDIVDKDGEPVEGKKKGDIICGRNGMPKIYRKLTILCRQQYVTETVFDEDWNEVIDERTGLAKQKPVRGADGRFLTEWVKNYSPEEVGDAQKDFMIPVTDMIREQFSMEVSRRHAIEEDEDFSE